MAWTNQMKDKAIVKHISMVLQGLTTREQPQIHKYSQPASQTDRHTYGIVVPVDGAHVEGERTEMTLTNQSAAHLPQETTNKKY